MSKDEPEDLDAEFDLHRRFGPDSPTPVLSQEEVNDLANGFRQLLYRERIACRSHERTRVLAHAKIVEEQGGGLQELRKLVESGEEP